MKMASFGLIVAPYMGAWIETHYMEYNERKDRSRTLYGCVDWNKGSEDITATCTCRTLYGCVDWNM